MTIAWHVEGCVARNDAHDAGPLYPGSMSKSRSGFCGGSAAATLRRAHVLDYALKKWRCGRIRSGADHVPCCTHRLRSSQTKTFLSLCHDSWQKQSRQQSPHLMCGWYDDQNAKNEGRVTEAELRRKPRKQHPQLPTHLRRC